MRFFLVVIWACFVTHTALADGYLQQLQVEAETLELHETNQWHALLYYKKHWLTGRLQSEVDDDRYFFSKYGSGDPEQELSATLSAFFSTTIGDDHPQCRFPARFYWLVETLSIKKNKLPQPNCKNFQDWFVKAGAGGATIIFPAAYLDSPSSMFGHTLLRLDQKDQNDANRILAYTVNYAARKSEEDSELLFVYRGLVGGYPGDTTILPYYMKLKEYSDIESRDIWEYRLNLTQKQTDQLVRHIWEIQSINFDYFFFTENCSYRVLGMLDVALPDQRMLENFNFYAIPIDTVRLPIERGIVLDVAYRPSIVTRFNHHLGELVENEKQEVYSMVMDSSDYLNTIGQILLKQKSTELDVAYEYSRIAKLPAKTAAKTSYRLLRARQKSESQSNLTAVPMPQKRDDEGHLSSRIRASVGWRNANNFLEFQVRPAYHDLTDPSLGYPIGSELKFFELTARYDTNNKSSIEEATLIGIKSLKGRTQFFKPVSWGVAIGAIRSEFNEKRALVPSVEGQMGPAYRWNNALFYGLFGGKFQLSSKLDKGFNLSAQGNIGLLWRGLASQLNLDFQYDNNIWTGKQVKKLTYQQVFNLNHQWALYFQLDRLHVGDGYLSESGLGIQFYY